MKLYYAPGACSIGIHVLLEEIGAPYEPERVNLREGEQYQPPFVAINPKSKVPTLVRDDGSVLTEFPAIAYWLARVYPQASLLADDLESQVRALEATDYIVATVHMQGFTRLFRPSNFAPSAADEAAVKARGREIAEKGFALIERTLDGKDFLVGAFSFADAALFYVARWAIALKVSLPPHCAAHYQRMLARPAVQRVLAREGLS